MSSVKIFRSDRDRRFYAVAELREARDLVRDVAWANGSMRGWDVIATGSKDGCLRIYELHADGNSVAANDSFGSSSLDSSALEKSPLPVPAVGGRIRNAPSGIGAGLAGSTSRESAEQRSRDGDGAPGRIKETVTLLEEINLHRGAIWKVAFSQGGKSSRAIMLLDLLASLNRTNFGRRRAGFHGR
jgi:nucleoporin SEH1